MIQGASQVILLLFLIAVGFLLGAVLGNWIGGREAASKAAKAAAQPRAVAPKPPLDPLEFDEMVSLWRKKTDGSLVVLRARQVVASASELGEAGRRQMEQTARDWLVWLGLLPGKAVKPTPVAAPTPERTSSQPLKAPVIYAPPPEPKPVQPPTILESVTQVLTPTLPDAGKPLSIVQQINAILQENLRETDLFKRGIRLAEDPREGVIVYIGLERYIGIDAVPDAEVKAAIKAAVAAWEQQSGMAK